MLVFSSTYIHYLRKINSPTLQGWTKEKIKLRLENSFIADVGESFSVDSSMSDVILINGEFRNYFLKHKIYYFRICMCVVKKYLNYYLIITLSS